MTQGNTYSEFRGPSHDTQAEVSAQSMLRSLKIDYEAHKIIYRNEWRCPSPNCKCVVRDGYLPSLVEGKHRNDNLAMQQMFYQPDLIVFEKDVIFIDGDIHKKCKHPKHDREEDEFLISQGYRIFRFSNATILEYPEEFVQFVQVLERLRMWDKWRLKRS